MLDYLYKGTLKLLWIYNLHRQDNLLYSLSIKLYYLCRQVMLNIKTCLAPDSR